jgi:hypothetical protein
MDELAMAIIGSRPASVTQRIGEKLQRSLRPPNRKARSESEQDMTVYAVYEPDDDVEDTEEDAVGEDQETSAKSMRALLAIVRMLTESGKVKRVVTGDDIQHAAYKGTTFTEKEKIVAAKIVNFLRPFVQQRTDDNPFPVRHILTCAPLAALANTIATIAGFPSRVRKLSVTSHGDCHALQLTASGIYDVLHGQWDIPNGDGNWITNSYQAGKHKPATFGGFFDMSRITSLMDSYGLQFAWRLSFVDKWTVRLLGKAKPGKKGITSNYEAQRKRGKYAAYTPTTDMMPTRRTDMETAADKLVEEIKSLANTLQRLHKELAPLELNRMNIGREIRKARRSWDPGSDDYKKLKKVRQEIAVKRLETIDLEKALVRANASLYSMNKALRVKSTTVAAATNTAISAAKEDNIESVSTLWLLFAFLLPGSYYLFFVNADESTSNNP